MGAATRRSVMRATLGLCGVSLLGVGACTQPPMRPTFPDLRFSHKQPFLFRARRVEVQSRYRRPGGPPHVEHLLPLAPDRAAGLWAEDRLQANGEGEVLVRFTVHDASVVEKRLTVERGLRGLLKTEQAQSYYAQLEATVELVDDVTGVSLGEANAKVWRSQTVPEDATMNERDETWFALVETLIGAFDTTMSARIAAHLGDHLVSAPDVDWGPSRS
ncbi:hypothetical protein [Roseospira visakhapatnamensis]|uniref:Lipoprotein n=1 Tax=Roseospira visakhapatnamensis TaxID=390880 RepID=A0A7W6REM6_9PROT|nr:hypothetical protein [Roseospira visakhapatnamensis]MBB4266656.1 hypothetical protein [Roseospira visakhapatnamensis]